ncbi:acetolactate synthase [Exidia glandulosa HHB12029]|uniref:Acetolactate synthase n=1 Tax=Exidia glandulosa HHB12029 TaxID=1314781 RepID=A0A165EPC0_EXIGL|nr:acetolactate synthase [Exidia glandulosa HHB12029]
MAATTVIQPIDMVKVRIQLAGAGVSTGPKPGPIAVARDIIAAGRVLDLYSGLSAGLMRQAVYTTARMGFFDTFMGMATSRAKGAERPITFAERGAAGLAAGGLAAVLGNPCDLALIRMQSDGLRPAAERANYRGVFDALGRIAKNEGVLALWSGCFPTVLRAMALNFGQLAFYSEAKSQLTANKAVPPAAVPWAASVVAGFFASFFSLPFDFVKTRLQNQSRGADGKLRYKGTIDCAVKVAREEGLLRFYRGFGTYFTRIAPHAMLTVLFADYLARATRLPVIAWKGQGSRHYAAAPATRPKPAQNFQQPPSHVPSPHAPLSPLVASSQRPALDSSFVGMSGGQIFHEMMLRHNVKHIFGYPGGAILPVFDAIYNSKHFNFVLPRHEQGAGHMAEGYARVSGKPGVVLVTSGPGATNVVTPLQDALMDGLPLVVFCGQVATSAIGSDAFQEADMVGISRSCTKWNVMVKDIAELPRRINEAFKIATSGRPGPVLVDLPKDVTASILRTPLSYKATTPGQNLGLPSNPLQTPAEMQLIRQAADLINQAKRPVVYAGNGVLSSPQGPALLATLSKQGNIPVTTTLQGLGAFDELDERSLHMLGMHGSAYANFAMQEADVIIALGARFDDRVIGKVDTFAPTARAAAAQGRGGIIHFEILPKNVNKVVDAHIPIMGDVVANLASMVPLIRPQERAEWFNDIRSWKKEYPFTYEKSAAGARMKPQEVIEELDRQTAACKENVILSTGVGQHQMWAAQFFRWRHPQSMVTSGGAGTMGFGLPAAIGAKVAAPEKMVIDVDGDASFSMTAMELATASQYNIGVKVLVLNNEFQGMVLQWQDLFYDHRYSHTAMRNPNFVLLAQAMGVHAIRATTLEELPAKMKEFIEYDGSRPVLFECLVETHEHVFPMVAAGKALHEQILHPALRGKQQQKS